MNVANGPAFTRLGVRGHGEESKHSKTGVSEAAASCRVWIYTRWSQSRLLLFLLLPCKWGQEWGKEREQARSVQDEALQSGSRRARWHLWPVKTASIHSIYFIIWVLWTVTWQKGHAMHARRKHGLQSPFIPHSAGVFILRTCGKTLQRAPGRELGTQPSVLSAMHLLWPVQVPHAPDLVGP